MRTNEVVSTAMAILAALLVVCCPSTQAQGPGTSAQAAPRTVKIGILAPLTGDIASWGDMQRKATELALTELKASGALDRLDLRMVYEDDKTSPRDGVNAFRKLVDRDKVPIVVGSPASTVTLAIAPIANQKHVVLLTSGSTAQVVANAGPFVFRIMPSDEVQALNMSDWARELGFHKVAILYVENAWGRGLMERFRAYYQKKGGRITAVESSRPDAREYRVQLTRVMAASPDAIYAPLYPRGAGLMIRQARAMGLKQQVLGADVYGMPEFIEAGRSAVNGVLYTTFGRSTGKGYDQFIQRYKARYGREPENYAAYCYDAFLVAVDAITRLVQDKKEITGDNLRRMLLSMTDLPGVTGVTHFGGKTSASGRTFDRMMVLDRKHLFFDRARWMQARQQR